MDDLPDPLEVRARARLGTRLAGRWKLDALLGIGGMASVYAATHRNGARAAIKLLHMELSLNPAVTRRFLREGYVANSIDHPGVVRVLDDAVTDDGELFLVMDLLDGESVFARAERTEGRLPSAEVLTLAHAVLDVLAAAHAKGVVHRDIKPDNIFVTCNGAIRVLDFGIARLRALSLGPSFATLAGSVVGTPEFMAPELALARTEEVDARTDLWAVGATMFTLLTGLPVHPATSVNEQLVLAATKAAQPLKSRLPNVPPSIATVVDRALAFAREERWQDARSMQREVSLAHEAIVGTALDAATARVAGRTMIGTGPPNLGAAATMDSPLTLSAGHTARRSRFTPLVVAGLAVVAFAVAGLAALRRAPPTAPLGFAEGGPAVAASSSIGPTATEGAVGKPTQPVSPPEPADPPAPLPPPTGQILASASARAAPPGANLMPTGQTTPRPRRSIPATSPANAMPSPTVTPPAASPNLPPAKPPDPLDLR